MEVPFLSVLFITLITWIPHEVPSFCFVCGKVPPASHQVQGLSQYLDCIVFGGTPYITNKQCPKLGINKTPFYKNIFAEIECFNVTYCRGCHDAMSVSYIHPDNCWNTSVNEELLSHMMSILFQLLYYYIWFLIIYYFVYFKNWILLGLQTRIYKGKNRGSVRSPETIF